jgi:hypothetical protein
VTYRWHEAHWRLGTRGQRVQGGGSTAFEFGPRGSAEFVTPTLFIDDIDAADESPYLLLGRWL